MKHSRNLNHKLKDVYDNDFSIATFERSVLYTSEMLYSQSITAETNDYLLVRPQNNENIGCTVRTKSVT